MDINEESLQLHEKHRGKLEIKSKIPLEDKHDLAVAYTPGVAAVSLAIGKDKSLAREYTIKHNTVAIVSDGSAILGLGNLGPEAALPVMEGKAILFKQFGNIDAFPICLDTQDTEEIIKTVKHLAPVFGGINLEDISAPRCFEIERRLRAELDIPVMHDDQHGTAVVVLAALINSLKLRGLTKEQVKIVINGAGAAGLAVTQLLLEYGFKNIVVGDTKGAIFEGRAGLNDEKVLIAKSTNREKIKGDLALIIKATDIFVGLSKPNLLLPEMIRSMNEKPIILALANPVPEIMPDQAHSAGAFIVATGRSDFPNQINNVLAFPGIFRGALDNGVVQFSSTMFINAANALAGFVQNPAPDKILPSVFDPGVAAAVAKAIIK
ncbi:MAG: malate dehydrogenase [Candidatus Doudnabacteria bacterium RIFCSPLOWO2_02_FULL_49_13]|uniref:Malate dehydrogenase n=1 Tax=Candidatus Doudnabacteria bacterium RIFCSPHIGHO2_12_FULL_48_16 TaxID=1817838 RepID=A0A1F5PL19_9BACT|nr:MAG: malate dehydrogenase [Candidatus Doudnabacteria bacterium RIFCSPHIGHO2_02_FULL_49_24]OGE89078.1 MAG: malate dehydrogenase [Candidatus Doudnabacteria bacterium RIFCSPHIGHO2_01_FULL_50_67]OGE90559.1 MAG: malate dehydrogenase [Candidatus Doudnabacteria bacterium RIFCSPHIGHO2_12_FULL_48_16]OGE97596.1 MAG: malate dehydrogenase [Candidatus Doudnabacteria bacterium RIFCSPLOWO2_01_FULL_49_40]OGF02951.1 MAG: malate dehydrogenase [Candidatus Doudnabacteria bacterium RIFCSPLOWO2_02_FULL_49_13]OGF